MIIIHVLVIVIHQMIQSLLGQMYFQTAILMVEQEVFADASEEDKYIKSTNHFLGKLTIKDLCFYYKKDLTIKLMLTSK